MPKLKKALDCATQRGCELRPSRCSEDCGSIESQTHGATPTMDAATVTCLVGAQEIAHASVSLVVAHRGQECVAHKASRLVQSTVGYSINFGLFRQGHAYAKHPLTVTNRCHAVPSLLVAARLGKQPELHTTRTLRVPVVVDARAADVRGASVLLNGWVGPAAEPGEVRERRAVIVVRIPAMPAQVRATTGALHPQH